MVGRFGKDFFRQISKMSCFHDRQTVQRNIYFKSSYHGGADSNDEHFRTCEGGWDDPSKMNKRNAKQRAQGNISFTKLF